MRAEYAIKAETLDGKIVTMRRGFTSHEAAEDYPVQLKKWKRVWVETVDGRVVQPRQATPKTPAEAQALLDTAFATIERAAIDGKRCPVNGTFGLTSGLVVALAKAGRIRIDVYALNWRVVTILTGATAGKCTAMPTFSHGPPYVTITKEGRRQLK